MQTSKYTFRDKFENLPSSRIRIDLITIRFANSAIVCVRGRFDCFQLI